MSTEKEVRVLHEGHVSLISYKNRTLAKPSADAVGVVLFLKDSNKFVFVLQNRPSVELARALNPINPIGIAGRGAMLEIPAGKIDPGEHPEDTARREVLEETGYEVEELIPLAEVFPSPGTSTEFIYLYLAVSSEAKRVQKGGGVDGENITLVYMDRKRFHPSELQDAKTVAGLLLAAHYLDL